MDFGLVPKIDSLMLYYFFRSLTFEVLIDLEGNLSFSMIRL